MTPLLFLINTTPLTRCSSPLHPHPSHIAHTHPTPPTPYTPLTHPPTHPPPSGLKDAPGQENEVYHYKLLAQMSAAIAHNQGGSIWGALCDGNDLWRFYRMTREDHTGREGIHCDEFLFGDFGDLGETDGAGGKESYPYSYHIQISPTLSVKHFDPAADSLKVVDYVLSLTHHDWMGCAENMYPGGRG